MASISKADFQLMSQTPLFTGLTLEEIETVSQLLPCRIKDYKKGEILVLAGDPVPTSGLVLKGRVKIYTAPNLDGTQAIIAEIGLGEMYSEPFNCLSYNQVPITVVASSATKVCLLDIRGLLDLSVDDDVVKKLLNNAIIQFAEKIIVFRNKIEVLSQPSLKMKILTTVKHHSEYQGTLTPTIPFSKKEFAEYLCVNRNTLSRALDTLEEEGELLVTGRRYQLMKPENMLFNLRTQKSPISGIHTRM